MNAGFGTKAEFARALGIREGTYRTYEEGVRMPRPNAIARIARRLGTTSHFLITGRVGKGIDSTIPIISKVGAGAQVEYFEHGPYDFAEIPPGDLQAMEVIGDSQAPRYLDGDLIVYSASRSHHPADCLYKECLVYLEDGRMYLKTVTPGTESGRYTLTSYNAAPIQNVLVDRVVPLNRRLIVAE